MKLQAKNNSMFVKFESIGDSCEGTFVEFNADVPSRFGVEDQLHLRGANGPLMVRCQTKLAAIIKDNLDKFLPASHVKIVFTKEVPTTKGNPMKDFDVEVDPPTAESLAEMAKESPPQESEEGPF